MKRKIIIVISMTIVLLVIIIYSLYVLNVIPHSRYNANDFEIEIYKSKIDFDNDGIDDQTDILNSVKEYIKTKPKYKSKYYSNGYPDDQYGVCTDVVINGLLGAGYDLMKLVNEDIKAHKEMYSIENIDINIDFRRVKNLKIYFDNNALSLTTDTTKIDEWQGGDIVVFKKHIGIISDNRNHKGIPFVIHHYSKFQITYEEDILENRNDIVGHYRIN